ncbi:MAG: DNA polymerase III subunit gamma/tau [Burkholderiales bacterium]|jgi:DNA polymerase-3 subunit gamma/tau|nr:DNA polymerase III subunit gamma/tau [Burkholderiales bacterium]
MSYQALARQWRPKTFAELVGQSHVVTALQNALTRGRIHHAYLLTGTRGVGKTTLARILAKSLNCEQGVTATPCGKCAACVAIDEGRFVDLLELDAASNTGVDNMREILDNARYAPTSGRYKVYLIDEVHMLSPSAFNSMLKTLEEPPEHVKFVLATTDPQKIPVTVLSRCLQFSLKPLPVEQVKARLAHILNAEKIAFNDGGLTQIAKAARGSLRDALSLLDQAIAYGAGSVQEEQVRAMLGTVDADYIYRLVEALAARDGAALLKEADDLAVRGLDAGAVLDELIALFHRIAVAQVVPEATNSFEDSAQVAALAARFTAEDVQLFYQIALQGRADLALSPDETMGMSMTLLRLLAFTPEAFASSPVAPVSSAPVRQETKTEAKIAEVKTAEAKNIEPPNVEKDAAKSQAAAARTTTRAFPTSNAEWPDWIAGLELKGMAARLAAHSEWRGLADGTLTLALPEAQRHLENKANTDKLKKALEEASGRRLHLVFKTIDAADVSLAAREQQSREQAQRDTEEAFRRDAFVQTLEKEGGEVRWETVQSAAVKSTAPQNTASETT